MTWILFHQNARTDAVKAYESEKGARIGVRAANRNAGYDAYAVLHEDDFYQRTVTVKNLMTGADIEIPASNAGTCADPSTERYWSM